MTNDKALDLNCLENRLWTIQVDLVEQLKLFRGALGR